MGWTREQIEDIIKHGKKFRGLKLYGVDFSGLDLEKADFRSASCPYSNFDDTNCKFANFEGANLTLTKWKNSDLHRSNLKDAILCDADMTEVKDFFGVTLTMDCKTWKGLKLSPGFWWGFLYYGLLMEPPSEDARDRLTTAMGPEIYTTLKNLYATRRM